MDDKLFFLNGRRPQKRKKEKDDLKKSQIFSRFLLNLGANLSWGWLNSLRFYRSIIIQSIIAFVSILRDTDRCRTEPYQICVKIDLNNIAFLLSFHHYALNQGPGTKPLDTAVVMFFLLLAIKFVRETHLLYSDL